MSVEPRKIKTIFLKAIEQCEPGQWDAFLDAACEGDANLQQRIEVLLKAHLGQDSLFDGRAGSHSPTILQPPPEEAGLQIGPYKLLEQIGEGGMGTVYLAEQKEPMRRRVALKVIKPGMDTQQVVARFEAERQALALMNHSNIAKVLDGGATEAGRPYFVMELVKGVPVTEFCDRQKLATRERLALFMTVCQAVQHAHVKGLIHRDIKPSNVLVELHDVMPVPKVIDFGVAKAIGPSLTEKSLHTGFSQMVGTPLYMSPEQAGESSIDVDTRSDIYSLGVLLYEVLTGNTPFDSDSLHKAGFDEMRRMIREVEPPRPSARISTLQANALSTIADRRRIEPRKLSQQLRGELDWIVMKALEKDRTRRYESASGFAADVERYLNDEPVQACPPSTFYRIRKFTRRNKVALTISSIVGLAVVIAVASMVLIGREQQATQTAKLAEARAEDNRNKAVERERRESYFHRITLAHRERALQLLAECPEDLRGWEWYYLMRLSQVEPMVLADKTEINSLAFSPDGERLASAGGDGLVKIWNSRTGDVVQSFKAHTDSVVAVAFHPLGKHVVSAGADLKVKVWDLATEQEVFTGPCDALRRFGTAYTVAFSPTDGRQLAAGSGGAVRVWDWKNRRILHTFAGHENHSIPLAFSHDGRRLATGGAFRQGQKLWDTAGGLPLRTFSAHRHPVSALAFSPDGRRLASASLDKSVKVSDTTTGALLHTLLHTGNVDCIAFSPNGRRLASAGEDKTVRIWNATTGREVLSLRGHTGRCGCVAFSPDGWRLASASTDGTIRFWDATPLRGDESQETLSFTQHTDEIYSVAFSPDSQKIASAGTDGLVKVWDAETGRVSAEFSRHPVVVFCVAWQPDGQRIASAGSEGGLHSVKVFDARNGQDAFTLPAGREHSAVPHFAVAFSPDGGYLVTGKGNGAVEVWEARTGREVAALGTHDREIRGLVFSPDGRHLASASSEGIVKIWDANRLDQKSEARLTLQARVPGASLNVAFSPDGRRLATGGTENTVIIWDVKTGRQLGNLRGHDGEVYTLAFSPNADGRWLASAGEDSAIKIWDSHAGTLVRSFRGHTGLVSSVAFSPDGRRLVSGSRDTTVKVWDVTQLSDSQGQKITEVLP